MTDVIISQDVPVPMRDGTRLVADLYRPAGRGQRPVLLQRTAYGKTSQITSGMLSPLRFANEGYVVVVQDGRGRYGSEGEFAPFVQEIEDGYDTVEWCAAQEWSDGAVGMYGMSYVGATQWLAAIAAPPSLRCLFPVMTAADYHDGWVYHGGAFSLAFVAAWTAQFLAIPDLQKAGLTMDESRAEEARLMRELERLRRTLSHQPLMELPLLARDGLAPYFHAWLRRPARDQQWERISIQGNHGRVAAPAFNVGGWYDLFAAGPALNFEGLRKQAATPEAREGQRLVMGPWTHNSPSISVAGARSFGYDATINIEELQLAWFDRWLRGREGALADHAPVRIYVMNQGWRDEGTWPLERAQATRYYLDSSGRANGLEGDGRLSRDEPGGGPPDLYLYNPNNPVPTIGAGGVQDQRPAEARTDVLVYTTAPLVEPVEVTGEVRAVLWIASSAPDTDFVARLVDVWPDGRAYNLCEGVLRARYRNSPAREELLEPGKPYELTLDMLVTSNLFREGHCIRLDVTSSSFPRFDRNPNTGESPALATRTVPALQTVFHDAEHASYVLLPVVPR